MRLRALGNFNTDLREVGKQMSGPTVDVAFTYVMAHALHARDLLRFGHLQCPMDGVRELRNVVGVNQQRIGKFVRRPREGAEDQRTALVVARRNKFFGHKVHSVVQRRDHAEGSRVVIARDLLMRMMLLEEHDGFPTRGLEARVDAFYLGAYLGEKILVTLDIRPARRADLHERKTLLIVRIQFQKALDGAEAFEDAFGVIHAIDADAEKGSLNAELGAQSRA